MSKDVKPKHRIGQTAGSRRKRLMIWSLLLLIGAGGGYAAYRYNNDTKVEVAVAKVRSGDFIISVRARGEIRSTQSIVLSAPQVPNPRIVRLAESGKPVKKGDVVVEFDAAQQEQNYLEKNTSVRTVDSEIVQTKASHRITDEMDAMNLMTAEYNLQRAELEASKAEVLSEIEGAKNRIDVGISEGELAQVKTTIGSHKVAQNADLDRLGQKKDKAVRDTERARTYLSKMVLRAPIDGVVNILPNFRSSGSFGSAPPPFKEGDQVWTGAAIAEIPNLSDMRIELKLDEVDRGKLKIGQAVKVRVDAIPEKEFTAVLDWISPIASVNFRGPWMQEKTFPAHATLRNLDPRLRPGMSASADIVIERQPDRLLIPVRASFAHAGKPAVYVQQGDHFVIRQIEVGRRNEVDMVVLSGLHKGETIALENPIEAAKKAKKL
ncbi:MAG TPA: efflux RND transporter periplasmic adaptor subunit [Bryobacteraceae bacterium]|jgi:HlyD family secretion protein|nr:efflux RND transporter periplasmic adaptor subunit [Bryobacteraceae bacterium]